MTKNKAVREAIEYAVDQLKTYLQPGMTVYTILQSVSRSGMQRKVSVYIMIDNKPIRITHLVATACGYRYDGKSGAVVLNGAGYDAATEIAHALSHRIYGDTANVFNTGRLY